MAYGDSPRDRRIVFRIRNGPLQLGSIICASVYLVCILIPMVVPNSITAPWNGFLRWTMLSART
jgi:hypothetical protein